MPIEAVAPESIPAGAGMGKKLLLMNVPELREIQELFQSNNSSVKGKAFRLSLSKDAVAKLPHKNLVQALRTAILLLAKQNNVECSVLKRGGELYILCP